ncbi:hypothetical protein PHET_03515 [Paragonimus heterotremus]|uniref:Small ribosomal subunit protein uS15m n=1 Tax=Paragonimus heterotremus TaxID=100268 RepID=A0A8J4T2V0_9TREM|nr:hypothetical protein PHET_03515 [Paragonimus heterotremus]
MLGLVSRLLSQSLRSTLTFSSQSGFHSTAKVNRWYRHFFQKKVVEPPKEVDLFPNDWEHKLYEPFLPHTVRFCVQQSPSFQNLDDRAKKMFTYQFRSKHVEFTDQLHTKLKEFGYHPSDVSVGAQVIRMTMKIRFKKKMLQEHPRNKTLRASTRALINDRVRMLRLLRATNLSEFNRLTKALEITGFRHPDPFDLPETNPIVERKKAVRADCFQLRLTKLANLKVDLAASEQTFYERKQKRMNKMLQDLASLQQNESGDGNMEDAKLMLENLFQEVIKERQSEVLSGPEQDALSWYANEAVQRERYAVLQAEKAQRQLRRKR